jgi:hypothetical protein
MLEILKQVQYDRYKLTSNKKPQNKLRFLVSIIKYFCLGRGGQTINKGVYIKYMTEVNCVVQQSPKENSN